MDLDLTGKRAFVSGSSSGIGAGIARYLAGEGVRVVVHDRAARYVLEGCGQTVDRIGQVEDIAYAVAFLASPKGGFLNGVNLHVDGGGTQSIY